MAHTRRRGWVLLTLVCITWGLLGGRLWQEQVVLGPERARQAVAQRMSALPLTERGQIRDRRGQTLTDAQTQPALAVFPGLLADPGAGALNLSPVLGVPAAELLQILSAPGQSPFWAETGLSMAQAAAVAALGEPGFAIALRTRRYGPNSLARHLVGYVNQAGGQQGLEATFNGELTGEAGPRLTAYLDGAGRPFRRLGVRESEIGTGDKEPWDLHLTLDLRLQARVEAILDATPSPLSGTPLRGAAVVLELPAGNVVAMASRPNFDQALGPAGLDARWDALYNRAAVAYPPGSLFKPLVAAVALDKGLVRPDELFTCTGKYSFGSGRPFTEPRPDGHGTITFQDAIARSCNITFVQVGYERLGAAGLAEVIRRFGLGEPTGLNLYGEAVPPSPRPQTGGEVAQLAFGQATLLATPLQLARAYAALALQGVLPSLGLVEKLTAPSGAIMPGPLPSPPRRAVGPAAAAQTAVALAATTDPAGHGTGHQAWVPGWGSAGKTGTAEAMVHGRPATHAWFAGWVPVGRPRYVIVVLVEDGGSGGGVAAPLFRDIALAALALGD